MVPLVPFFSFLTRPCFHSLVIHDDPFAVGDYVANYIAKRYRKHPSFLAYDSVLTPSINDFAPTADKPFVLGLPTGSSPTPTYKALIEKVKQGSLS